MYGSESSQYYPPNKKPTNLFESKIINRSCEVENLRRKRRELGYDYIKQSTESLRENT